MCKYCKRLKQLKDLDEKRYKKIIHAWQRRDFEARVLLNDCLDFFHAWPVPFNAYQVHEKHIKKFLECNWIGK